MSTVVTADDYFPLQGSNDDFSAEVKMLQTELNLHFSNDSYDQEKYMNQFVAKCNEFIKVTHSQMKNRYLKG